MKSLNKILVQLELDSAIYQTNQALFEQAFVHRSAARNNEDNERLEFLGDAVLELVTTQYLYQNYPLPEGDLTNYRSALVKRENLAAVARKLDLGSYLVLSKGEDRSGGREKDYLLANTVEALLGAIYLSFGLGESTRIITTYVLHDLERIVAEGAHIDAKTQLQEFTQGHFRITPKYQVEKEHGKDHEKEFHTAVFLERVKVGSGHGRSKKEAETAAALDAWQTQKTWKPQFKLVT